VLPFDVSVLQRPVLPLDVPVLQQPMLPLDMSIVYPTAVFSASGLTRTCSKADFADCLCQLSIAACAASDRLCSTVQQPVLPLDVYVCLLYSSLYYTVPGGVWPAAACFRFKCTYLFNSSQCCAKRCMAYNSLCCCCIYTVCLQEPVLHLDVSIYTGFCATPGVSVYKAARANGRVCLQEPCAAPGCVCLQELCATPGRVCLQKPLLHLCVSACLQELCDGLEVSVYYSPRCNCRCWVVKKNWFVSICFKTTNRYVYFGCFDTCSKHRNKPKQTEKFIFWFRETNRKTTETD
jgi:hypothetical protein